MLVGRSLPFFAFLFIVPACDERNKAPVPTTSFIGTDLLKGHPRAERIIQRFGGAEAYNLIQSATHAEAVRIDRIRDGLSVWDARVKDYPVIAKGEPIDAELLWRIKHVLVNPTGGIKTCLPRYGVKLRLADGSKHVDVLLCYYCNLFGVFLNGKMVGTGAFDADRPELVAIAKQLFPADNLLQNMRPLGCASEANPSPPSPEKNNSL